MHRRTAQALARTSRPAARRILMRAATRGDPNAIEAVWQAWLRHPDDETFQALKRGRGERELTADVFAIVIDPARDAASRAAIGAFCVRRGIAPDGDTERALFFAATGQLEQLRGADPDGAALTTTYAAADESTRAVLRQAMADSGDLSLVRAIVARDRGTPVMDAERAYLVAELVRHRDWAALWRAALGFPLADAAAAVRRLPGDWRPRDEGAGRLFSSLAVADPAEIEAQTRGHAITVTVPVPVTVPVTAPGGRFVGPHIAPDGSEVALIKDNLVPRSSDVGIYSFPDGRVLESLHKIMLLLYLGSEVFCIDSDGRCLLRQVRGGATRSIGTLGPLSSNSRIRQIRGGFVLSSGSHLLHGAVTGAGFEERRITWSHPRVAYQGDGVIVGLDSEPSTGHVAFAVEGNRAWNEVVVLGPDLTVIDERVICDGSGSYEAVVAGFCGPGRLVTIVWGPGGRRRSVVSSWDVGPSGLIARASTTRLSELSVAVLPLSGVVIGFDVSHTIRECLDAETLEPVERPRGLACLPEGMSNRFSLSPDGRCLAFWPDGDTLEVRDLLWEEIAGLLERPLANLDRRDLGTVAKLAGQLAGHPAMAVIGLLRDFMDYRFGADIAIGDARAALGGDDIAMNPSQPG